MKKLFVIAAMIAACSTVSAQFTNSYAGSSSTSVQSDGWSTLYVQYNPITLSNSNDDAIDSDLTGITLGYNKVFGISKSKPLYVEIGAGLTYAWHSDTEEVNDYTERENTTTLLSLKVPVSILYNYRIPNSTFSICPFTGLTFRYNLSGNSKQDYSGRDANNYEDLDINLFDKDDMGSDDATYKRFQIGWQIGLSAKFSDKYVLGISYDYDLSGIAKKLKVNTTSITFGYSF